MIDSPGEIVAVGTGGVALLWKIIDWSVNRNVKVMDAANDARDREIDELKKAQALHKEQLLEAKHAVSTMASAVESLRGMLSEIKITIESSRDRQANFYREELQKLEISFRQEMAKSSGNDALMLVRKLEKDILAWKRKK